MEYLSRLRKFWFQDLNAFLWLLLAIPVMISFHSIIHEGTHSLAAYVEAGEFPKIAPFLMDYEGKFQNGKTIGVYTKQTERTDCDESVPPEPNHERQAGWSGWPQVVALLITIFFAVIFLAINIQNPIAGFLWRTWYLAAAVDFVANTGSILFGNCKEGQDWAKVMIRGDHGFGAFRWFTLFLWLILFSHFVWVYWSKWGKTPLPDRSFWGYRYAAVTLGILAFISLMFYAFVRDDGIEYTSGWYIFGLLAQISAFIFYSVYVVISIKRAQ